MLYKKLFLLLLFVCVKSFATVDVIDTLSQRNKVNINQGWQYHKGIFEQSPEDIQWNTKGWDNVNLPHTYQLTSINLDDSDDDKSQKTFHRDVSWYQKSMVVDAKDNQNVFLEFEGAHQRTQLWVNNRYVGEHATGAYTPFHFDITEYIKPNEENTFVVFLDNRVDKTIPPDGHTTDYVLFGGLYRDVYLTVTDELHFSYNWESKTSGIYITTPTVSKRNATVSVRSEVKNDSTNNKNFTVLTQIVNADGTLITKTTSKHQLRPQQKSTIKHTLGLSESEVNLWSPESPYLYRVYSQIIDNNKVVDTQYNPLGLRTFELRLGEGLLLNGKPIEIIGANRHQHYPYIGDAVPNNLHRNDAIKFKQAGMNLVRLAHYPHDNSFIEACDELGLIVVEEPPSWIEIGGEVWMDRLEQAARVMIRNHRNHPSILGWGAGINHRGTVKRLHYAAKEEDPTRITMNNGTLWTGEQHSGVTDLYAVMDYRGAVRQPHDLLFAMEHSGSRDTKALQEIVSRYKADPNLIGLASWSAHDSQSFIKRDEQYPNLSVWKTSTWDAFRLPKPVFYWYKSELTEVPMVHIPDKTAQTETHVQVFSNAESIALFHNNKKVGVFYPTVTDKNKHIKSPSFLIPFQWKQGTLTAHALQKGKRVASHTRSKPNQPTKISLTLDTTGYDFSADGSSIVLAYAYIQDENNQTIESDTPAVTFKVSGNAEIIGDKTIGSNPVVWRNGVAPVLIRVGNNPSKIVITASSEGLIPDHVSFNTKPWLATQDQNKYRFIKAPLALKVDMGGVNQHPQEDFILWSHHKGEHTKEFTATNGRKVQALITSNKSINWKDTGGVPGDLSFMIEDGVEVPANSTLTLQFKQLPIGRYILKTWHHMLSDKREDVTDLMFSFKEKKSKGSTIKGFQPTFGRKIIVSEAGGGNKGDGGSIKGAKGYAEHTFLSDGKRHISLVIESNNVNEKTKKTLSLNGFELEQIN